MATASTLKGLTFTAMPAATFDPVIDRRNRTITKLEDQKKLLSDSTYQRPYKGERRDQVTISSSNNTETTRAVRS